MCPTTWQFQYSAVIVIHTNVKFLMKKRSPVTVDYASNISCRCGLETGCAVLLVANKRHKVNLPKSTKRRSDRKAPFDKKHWVIVMMKQWLIRKTLIVWPTCTWGEGDKIREESRIAVLSSDAQGEKRSVPSFRVQRWHQYVDYEEKWTLLALLLVSELCD